MPTREQWWGESPELVKRRAALVAHPFRNAIVSGLASAAWMALVLLAFYRVHLTLFGGLVLVAANLAFSAAMMRVGVVRHRRSSTANADKSKLTAAQGPRPAKSPSWTDYSTPASRTSGSR